MATVTKEIGPISAYAIAVEEGYTGTKAEFANEIANASTNAQTASTALQNIQALVHSFPDSFTTFVEDLAQTYSTSGTYAVGDYINYEGQLYVCNTAVTASSWDTDSSCFTAVDVGSMLTAISKDIDSLADDIYRIDHELYDTTDISLTSSDFRVGYFNRNTGTSSITSTYKRTSAKLAVDGYDRVEILQPTNIKSNGMIWVCAFSGTPIYQASGDNSQIFVESYEIGPGKKIGFAPQDGYEYYLSILPNDSSEDTWIPTITGMISLKKRVDDIEDETEVQAQILNGTYSGQDLTAVFQDEIANYSGDAWAWIKARVNAEDYSGIHIGDYIPFTCTNDLTRNAVVMGINTYKNCGPQSNAITSHIDFIFDVAWATALAVNKANYNNGTSESPVPWLASNAYLFVNSESGLVPSTATADPTLVESDYTQGGIYYYLPSELKAVISPKYMVCNSRYSAGNLLTNDNGADWYNIGNLWVLTEEELTGKSIYGTTGVNHGGGAVQYPLFAGNSAGKYVAYGSTRSYRRLFNAPSGSSASFITIDPKGDIYYEACSSTRRYQPCFRIMAD